MRNTALWAHSRHFLNLRPVYALGEWMLDSMPLWIGYAATWWVTESACLLSPWLTRALSANIGQVLRATQPGLSAAQVARKARAISHRTFINRGFWFLDLSLMAGRRRIRDCFSFEMEGNWPALTRVRASGRGAILVSAHLGNWFGGGIAVARHGIPVRTVMYRNHAGDFMDQKVARRGDLRQTFVDEDPFSMMEVVRALRGGELVAMLGDKPWDARSALVPFFGRPARFPLGTVKLARLAGVPLFPAFCVYDRPRRFRAILCDPIEVSGGDPDQAELKALEELARVMEKYIAAHLDIWFNFTPVWEDPVESR
ncbi:MAG TPA: lysophospholipid acyltransferase family protein [Planctomycetota bacterium]|nr:lysophospholipid acyltransferase family protein [Planctomycetota bacterium]